MKFFKSALFWILLISFLAKLGYVFYFTDYSHYLFSDCGGYWNRALDRLAGKEISYTQWAIWPVFPHIILACLFRVLQLLQIFSYKHEIVIFLNVLLSTACVYLLYKISCQLSKNKKIALLISFAYAFSFPYFYFNAFVLSEHPAQFLLFLAIYLVIFCSEKNGIVFLAGFVLGVSAAIRPANAFLGLPFFLYVLIAKRISLVSFVRASIFSIGFFIVITLVAFENYRISEGSLKGFSINGGVNFYLAQCDVHRVISHYEGYTYTIVPPGNVANPEKGVFEYNEPFFNQAFYYNLGMQCLEKSGAWWTRLTGIKKLYFSPLFPSATTAWGRFPVMEWFRYVALILSMSGFLFFVLLSDPKVDKMILFFLLSLVSVSLVTLYIYNWEYRYMYYFLYLFYILFFAIGNHLCQIAKNKMQEMAKATK